jgi:hypothetical protein
MSEINYGLAYYQPPKSEDIEKAFSLNEVQTTMIITMFQDAYKCGYLDGKQAIIEDWAKDSRERLNKSKELINKVANGK